MTTARAEFSYEVKGMTFFYSGKGDVRFPVSNGGDLVDAAKEAAISKVCQTGQFGRTSVSVHDLKITDPRA